MLLLLVIAHPHCANTPLQQSRKAHLNTHQQNKHTRRRRKKEKQRNEENEEEEKRERAKKRREEKGDQHDP